MDAFIQHKDQSFNADIQNDIHCRHWAHTNKATASRIDKHVLPVLVIQFVEDSTCRLNKFLNCATRYVASTEIEESLLNAKDLG